MIVVAVVIVLIDNRKRAKQEDALIDGACQRRALATYKKTYHMPLFLQLTSSTTEATRQHANPWNIDKIFMD